jgi:hypothetical protein
MQSQPERNSGRKSKLTPAKNATKTNSIRKLYDESDIDSAFNEYDDSSPDSTLRNLINFEVYDSNTNEYVAISDITKTVESAYVIADVIVPLDVSLRNKLGDVACTVRQSLENGVPAGNAIDSVNFSKFVNANLSKLDRHNIQVVTTMSIYSFLLI